MKEDKFSILGQNFLRNNSVNVNNYIKYNTQCLASPQEEEAEPASSEVIAAKSKAKAKTPTEGIIWHDDHSI